MIPQRVHHAHAVGVAREKGRTHVTVQCQIRTQRRYQLQRVAYVGYFPMIEIRADSRDVIWLRTSVALRELRSGWDQLDGLEVSGESDIVVWGVRTYENRFDAHLRSCDEGLPVCWHRW